MPRPFPMAELRSSEFTAEATGNVKFADDRIVEGPIPDEKEIFTCETHGEFSPIYIPKHKSITDGIKGLPADSHKIVCACKSCVKDEESRLLGIAKKKRSDELDASIERDMLMTIESRGVSLRNINYMIQHMKPVNDTQDKAISKCKDIGNAIKSNKNAGNLILSGSVGTGKTLIAGALVTSLTREKYKASIMTISSIIRDLKGTWRRDSEYTEQDIITELVNLDLLAIDEIGVQFGSDTEKMFIFEIIDGRYNKMKPTILISNLSIGGIKELIGERCINRLKEDGGKVIAFDFESQRGKK